MPDDVEPFSGPGAEAAPAAVADKRSQDRRQDGSAPRFGPERRRGNDRRACFGKVETLLERDGIRITRDGAAFPAAAFKADEIVRVELATQFGKSSLAWFLYAALALVTAFQALLAHDLGLWAIAGAIVLFSSMTWRRRETPARYDILVESHGGLKPVLQTPDKGFATLVHDAIIAIQSRSATLASTPRLDR